MFWLVFCTFVFVWRECCAGFGVDCDHLVSNCFRLYGNSFLSNRYHVWLLDVDLPSADVVLFDRCVLGCALFDGFILRVVLIAPFPCVVFWGLHFPCTAILSVLPSAFVMFWSACFQSYQVCSPGEV